MKKKFVLGLTSLVVASAVAIGGTLAFMTAKTDEKSNDFKAVGSLSGQIKETKWDGLSFDKTPDTTLPADTVLGSKMAENIVPGMDIPKDPMLKNTSKIPVYMAIKVTYDAEAQNAFLGKDAYASFITDPAWKKLTGSKYTTDSQNRVCEYYVYGTAGTNNNINLTEVGTADTTNTTKALFNSVTISKDAINAQMHSQAFNLKIEGCAVQTQYLANAQTPGTSETNSPVAIDELFKELYK